MNAAVRRWMNGDDPDPDRDDDDAMKAAKARAAARMAERRQQQERRADDRENDAELEELRAYAADTSEQFDAWRRQQHRGAA